MKRHILIIITLFSTYVGFASDAYLRGGVTLQAKQNVIQVEIAYELSRPDTSSTLSFLLARNCQISFITGKVVERYASDTTTRPERTIIVHLSANRNKAEPVTIYFSYLVPFDSSRFADEGFIELGLDWFWFPVHPSISQWDLAFDLKVSTSDASLSVFSNGKADQQAATEYRVRSVHPGFDVDLFFLRDAKVYAPKSKSVIIAGNADNPPLKDSIAEVTASYLEWYNNYYSTGINNVTCVFRPRSKNPIPFGYARAGYFVLSEPPKLADVKFYIAHEVGHLWFRHGEPTLNAWLTESLAEYNAMLLTRYTEGVPAFDSIIADKRARINRVTQAGKVLPAVHNNGSKGKSILAQMSLYHKGPLVLYALEQRIGASAMQKVLREVYHSKASSTAQFLTILEQHTDKATRMMMADELEATTGK